MKQIVDALELLTAQHEDVAVRLAMLPTMERSQLAGAFGELADRVTTHLAVEEQFLSTLGLSVPVTEHAELRTALAELLATELDSSKLSNRLQALTTRWAHHASPQEQQIFIALAETLPSNVLADLGVHLSSCAEQSRCIAA